MNILIAGGSGTLGRHLIPAWIQAGHQVVNLSRGGNDPFGKISGPGTFRQLIWDGHTIPDPGFSPEMIVNLAGTGLADASWTPARRKLILDSRIRATRACVDFIRKQGNTVQLFVNASAVGFYGAHREEPSGETAAPGTDFLAEVCMAWEQEALRATVRTVLLRTGIVLSSYGGAFPKLLPVFKAGIGGWLGSGKQAFPWIDAREFEPLLNWLLEHPEISGPVNVTAPGIVTNKEFSKTLAAVLHKPCLFPVPGAILKLMLGSRADLVLKGQNAIPEKLLRAGYSFAYPDLGPSLDFHRKQPGYFPTE